MSAVERTILSVFSRYKRKGSSSLGLDHRTQGISWEESESNKKQKGGDKKRAADRYFSTANRQLLRSQPTVPTLPTVPESSEVIGSISFLPLGCDEGEGKGGVTGKGLIWNLEKSKADVHCNVLSSILMCYILLCSVIVSGFVWNFSVSPLVTFNLKLLTHHFRCQSAGIISKSTWCV